MEELPQSIYTPVEKTPSIPTTYLFNFLSPRLREDIVNELPADDVAEIQQKQELLHADIVRFIEAKVAQFFEFSQQKVLQHHLTLEKNALDLQARLDRSAELLPSPDAQPTGSFSAVSSTSSSGISSPGQPDSANPVLRKPLKSSLAKPRTSSGAESSSSTSGDDSEPRKSKHVVFALNRNDVSFYNSDPSTDEDAPDEHDDEPVGAEDEAGADQIEIPVGSTEPVVPAEQVPDNSKSLADSANLLEWPSEPPSDVTRLKPFQPQPTAPLTSAMSELTIKPPALDDSNTLPSTQPAGDDDPEDQLFDFDETLEEEEAVTQPRSSIPISISTETEGTAPPVPPKDTPMVFGSFKRDTSKYLTEDSPLGTPIPARAVPPVASEELVSSYGSSLPIQIGRRSSVNPLPTFDASAVPRDPAELDLEDADLLSPATRLAAVEPDKMSFSQRMVWEERMREVLHK